MNYKFENRKKDKNKVCFILAGYKEFLYDVIFERILKFIPEDVEICLLSSGKYSQILSEIAEKNNWSYLSTKRNNVSLIQNVAITIFNKADYIYKLDEDILKTQNTTGSPKPPIKDILQSISPKLLSIKQKKHF